MSLREAMRPSNLKLVICGTIWIASLMLAMTTVASGVLAQDEQAATAQDDNFAQRLELAQQMVTIQPAEEQMENAIDSYIRAYLFTQPKDIQDRFREAILSAMKPKALEKISIDAYAEIFTVEELQAMVAYYSSPEAKSAAEKRGQLNARISPEISKQLDAALIRLKTGQ